MLLILYTLEPVDDVFCIFLLIHVEFMSKFFVHCLYNNNNNNTKNNNNNSGNNNKVNRGNNNSKINYIQRESNHPPSIIKQLPLSVESRLSKVSSDENVFIQGQGTITNFIITVIITVINIIIIIIKKITIIIIVIVIIITLIIAIIIKLIGVIIIITIIIIRICIVNLGHFRNMCRALLQQ